MTRLLPALLVAACFVLPAQAQQERSERDPLKMMARRLKTELALDSAQQQTFDRLVADARKEASKRGPDALRRVLAEAHQASRKGGDMSRFREQLAGMINPPQLALLDALEPSLRAEQVRKLMEIRKRFDPATSLNPSGIMEAFAITRTDLKLEDKQGEDYDKIAAGMSRDLQPGVKTKQLSQSELDEVLAALQEAMESGNEAAIPDIGKRVLADQKDRGAVLQDGILAINAMVNDNQRRVLGEMAARLGSERTMQREGTAPQLLTRAARRCQLTAEQQTQLKTLEKKIDPGAMRRDPALRASTIYDVRAAVEAMLDERQLEVYRRELQSPNERAKNRAGKGGGKKAEKAGEAKKEEAAAPDKP